jgi:hypothetical protein
MDAVQTRDQLGAAEYLVLTSDERLARAEEELDEARRAREQAIRDEAKARRENELAVADAAADAGRRIKAMTVDVEAALALARREANVRPDPGLRLRAREFLIEGDGPKLLRLGDADPITGLLHGQSQSAARLMTYLDGTLAAEAYKAEADRLEVRCWSAMMARIRFLAGEIVPDKVAGTFVK